MSKTVLFPFEPKICTQKPRWPSGPWHNEPDLGEFKVAGLRCAIIRHPELGHLCGYVHVPRGHPLDGVSSSDRVRVPLAFLKFPREPAGPMSLFFDENNEPCVEALLTLQLHVHGGITYSKHIAGGSGKGTWFGFDCCHCGDRAPGNTHSAPGEEYRDWEYVVGETERLAEQLSGWPGVAE